MGGNAGTNVLRQRMDRRHIRVGMEMVKPLSGSSCGGLGVDQYGGRRCRG